MKKFLLSTIFLTSISSFAYTGIKILSLDARAQVFQENGIIITITGEAAEYMYTKGETLNGVEDIISLKKIRANITRVEYGNFNCERSIIDYNSLIPGNTISYQCKIDYNDQEL